MAIFITKGIHRCAACSIEPDLVQAYTWYRLFEKSARYDGERAYERILRESVRNDKGAIARAMSGI